MDEQAVPPMDGYQVLLGEGAHSDCAPPSGIGRERGANSSLLHEIESNLYERLALTLVNGLVPFGDRSRGHFVGRKRLNDLEESEEIVEACDQFTDLTQPGLRDRLEKVLSGQRNSQKRPWLKPRPKTSF